MERKNLVSNIRREALARVEEAARSVEDFNTVIDMWNHLDENRERKERYHEVQRSENGLVLNYAAERSRVSYYPDGTQKHIYSDGMIFPTPFPHPSWREVMRGDFLSFIFDNAEEMWQLIEDCDIALPVKTLSKKQADVLFLSAVRHCTPQHIACYHDKTDRAVRKLYSAALKSIRNKIAPIIREQMESEHPQMTINKRKFIEWYYKNR